MNYQMYISVFYWGFLPKFKYDPRLYLWRGIEYQNGKRDQQLNAHTALLCSKWSEHIDKMHSKKSLGWQEKLLYNRQKETEQNNPQLQVNIHAVVPKIKQLNCITTDSELIKEIFSAIFHFFFFGWGEGGCRSIFPESYKFPPVVFFPIILYSTCQFWRRSLLILEEGEGKRIYCFHSVTE